jgi:hypothetical protein
MDDFIFTAQAIAAAKLAVSLGVLAFVAWGAETIFGLAPRSDINAIQKAAEDGNAMPLALFYLGILYLLSVLLGRFQ